MSYTPPVGSAVAFRQIGAGYSPPSYNAVNFIPIVVGAGVCLIDLSPYGEGVFGVTGSSLAELVTDGILLADTYGGTTVTGEAGFRTVDFLYITAVGDIPFCGYGSVSLPFLGGGTGVGAILCDAALPVVFTGYAEGIIAAVGTVAFGLGVVAAADGYVPVTGPGSVAIVINASSVGATDLRAVGYVELPITATGGGTIPPCGIGSALVPILAIGTGAVGNVGIAAAGVPFEIASIVYIGRTGEGIVSIALHAAGVGACGVFGSGDAFIDVFGQAIGIYINPVSGYGLIDLVLGAEIYGTAWTPPVDENQLFIRTKQSNLFVVTE